MITQLGFCISILCLLIMMIFDLPRDHFYTLATFWFGCLLVSFFGPIFATVFSLETRPSFWFVVGSFIELMVAFFLVLHAYGKGFK